MKTKLVAFVVFAVLLLSATACGGRKECTFTMNYVSDSWLETDPSGSWSTSMETTARFNKAGYGDRYFLSVLGSDNWSEFDQIIQQHERELDAKFVALQPDFRTKVAITNTGGDYGQTVVSDVRKPSCDGLSYLVTTNPTEVETVVERGYTLKVSLGLDSVYFTVSSEGGSFLTYAVSYEGYRNMTSPQVAGAVTNEGFDQSAYAEQLISQIIGQSVPTTEVVTFQFLASDLEGRQEMQSMLEKAVWAASLGREGQYDVVFMGYDGVGTFGYSLVDLQHTANFRSGRWYSGTGNSSVVYHEDSTTITTAFVQGSLFLVPVSR